MVATKANALVDVGCGAHLSPNSKLL
jgi:hypothetical protein